MMLTSLMNTPSIAYNRQAYGEDQNQTQQEKNRALLKEIREIRGNPNLRNSQHIARHLEAQVDQPDPSVKSDT